MTQLQILSIIQSWERMIGNPAECKYPTAVLNDLIHSMQFVRNNIEREGIHNPTMSVRRYRDLMDAVIGMQIHYIEDDAEKYGHSDFQDGMLHGLNIVRDKFKASDFLLEPEDTTDSQSTT